MKNFDVGNISLEARRTLSAMEAEIEKWQVCEAYKVVCLWDGLIGRATGSKISYLE